MGSVSKQYPASLAKVIGHAKRLMKVLSEFERVASTDTWFLGRSGELRGVVHLAVADWRSGVRDTDEASESILAHVDALHRRAARKLRCGLALDCCEVDDVITAVSPGETEAFVDADTDSGGLAQVTNGPTVPAGWVDGPEVLARVEEGLDLVDMLARVVGRRFGATSAVVDELRASGHLGLLDAARTFDESRRVPFRRWASLQIRSRMADAMRQAAPFPRRARRRSAREEAGSPHDASGGPDARDRASHSAPIVVSWDEEAIALVDIEGQENLDPSPEEVLVKAQAASMVRAIVAKLPDQRRKVIELTYFHGQSLAQAAAAMGIDASWAVRLHADAVEILARELRKRESAGGDGVWAPRKA